MSKRILNHPQTPASGDAVTSWRSVGDKERSAHFEQWKEREFPAGSSEMSEEERKMSRRQFNKLMGASSALAGLTLASCRRAESYIVPYKKAPEWIIPGKPLFYATSMPRPEGALPLVVTTFEGRPTKVEPNTEHPDRNGADAFAQASVLDLYAPNRSQEFLKKGKKTSRKEINAALKTLSADLSKTAFVFGADHSPTRDRLAAELAGKGATLVSYEALEGDGRRVAYKKAFGGDTVVKVDFAKADKILSLDCDFLGTDSIGSSREFSRRRQGGGENYDQELVADKMNRLYQVETAFTLTGGLADHRLRVKPSLVLAVGSDIAEALGAKGATGATKEEKASLFLGATDPSAEYAKWVAECAADLQEGNGIVLAGSRHDEALHNLAMAMNVALGAYGAEKALIPLKTGKAEYETIDQLRNKVADGVVENVVLLTPADPLYDAPGFTALMNKAKVIFHHGTRTNKTAWASSWHIPGAHYLESWSDARSCSGVHALLQPMILPLYGGISELDLVHTILNESDLPEGDESPAMAEVQATFAAATGNSDEAAWKEALKEGFLADSSYEAAGAPTPGAVIAPTNQAKGLELVFASDASVWDGRYIDNVWLQEAPDPVTKVTWDNAAQISPQTAKDLGIYDHLVALETKTASVPENGEGESAVGQLISLKVNNAELVVPVIIAFGHADGAITLPLGYGQAADDGRQGATAINANMPVVGDGGLNSGFNAYRLRAIETPYFTDGVEFSNANATYPLAFTQDHHSMYGRALAREISTNDVDGKGNFEQQLDMVKKQGMDSHAPANVNIYKPKGTSLWGQDEKKAEKHLWDDLHQWGMSIDLNTCTGCNACLVACQAENNIPVVGKEQVAKGREMHWIRMDRYFASQTHVVEKGHVVKDKETPEWVQQNPEMMPQPVACVQCEQAPCETVCPVNATVHTEEGLNAMAYNRCIGTRYCANNCPYKARRFNFFDYNKRNPLIKKNLYKGPFGEKQVGTAPHLQRNPNVTVRMRGVMEKCTYCVQRLEGAKIKKKQQVKYNVQASGEKSTAYKVDRVKDLRIKTDSVKTACQSACEADAISFGNLLDEKSKVFRSKNIKRNYDLLNYLNTRPRTSYLARVKNPNSKMPDAKYLGQATIHVH